MRSPTAVDEKHSDVVDHAGRLELRRGDALVAVPADELSEIQVSHGRHALAEQLHDGLGLGDRGIVAADQDATHRFRRSIAACSGELGLDASRVLPDARNITLHLDDTQSGTVVDGSGRRPTRSPRNVRQELIAPLALSTAGIGPSAN